MLEQTKTIFSGEINKQKIIDIPCEAIIVEREQSEPMEVPKETELNESTDDSVNEVDTEQSSQKTES